MYKTKKWRNLRERILRRHPICAACKRLPASQIDHIVPRTLQTMANDYDIGNLQALCAHCHSEKTMGEMRRKGQLTPRKMQKSRKMSAAVVGLAMAAAGCAHIPSMPTHPVFEPKPAAPLVQNIVAPLQKVSAENKQAITQAKAIPLTPAAAVQTAKQAVIHTLQKQAVAIRSAQKTVTIALPAVKQSDRAAKDNAKTARKFQAELQSLQNKQVQMVLDLSVAVGGICILIGVLEIVVFKNIAGSFVFFGCGAGLIFLTFFVAQHLILIEWSAVVITAGMILYEILARHHLHVAKTVDSAVKAASAVK